MTRPVVGTSAPEIPESGGAHHLDSTDTAGRMTESQRQGIRRALGKAAPEEIIGEAMPMSEQELAEIEALHYREAFLHLPNCNCRRCKGVHVLISEVRRLRRDAERLDWLEGRHVVKWAWGKFTAMKTDGWFMLGPNDVAAATLREAIDSAMEATNG